MEKQPLVFDKEVQIVSKALNMFLTFPHAVDDMTSTCRTTSRQSIRR
jgi:hypothetical protein